jgi:hypothetical protein
MDKVKTKEKVLNPKTGRMVDPAYLKKIQKKELAGTAATAMGANHDISSVKVINLSSRPASIAPSVASSSASSVASSNASSIYIPKLRKWEDEETQEIKKYNFRKEFDEIVDYYEDRAKNENQKLLVTNLRKNVRKLMDMNQGSYYEGRQLDYVIEKTFYIVRQIVGDPAYYRDIEKKGVTSFLQSQLRAARKKNYGYLKDDADYESPSGSFQSARYSEAGSVVSEKAGGGMDAPWSSIGTPEPSSRSSRSSSKSSRSSRSSPASPASSLFSQFSSAPPPLSSSSRSRR